MQDFEPDRQTKKIKNFNQVLFPTYPQLFVAFQNQGSMTMVSQPPQHSQSQFVYECIQPYREMVDNPIYPKRLRNKLKSYIRYIEFYSIMLKMSLYQGDEENIYGTKMAKKLEELEQIAQELDRFIQ